MIDPTSFMLGMLAHDFLTRAVKKSQVTAVMLAALFGLILFNILLQVGAFDYIMFWWTALRQ
jgi:hypothetical protein